MNKEKLRLVKRQIKQSDKLFETILDLGYEFEKPRVEINWFGEVKKVLPFDSDVI